MASSAAATAFSMDSSYFGALGLCLASAALVTASTSLSMLVFLAADMGTTWTPSALDRPSASILSPRRSISSIMFRAMTMGLPVSMSCSERNRFLSRFVASTMLITASGLSWMMKFLDTISSGEYGDSE